MPAPEKSRPHERHPQVLALLAEHGPLTAGVLGKLLAKPSSARALREVLKRLHDRKLLARRIDNVTSVIYHQIRQDPAPRKRVAKILNTTPESLLQPHYRYIDLPHNVTCAYWKTYLRLLFPAAELLRRHELASDPCTERLFPPRQDERGLRPDLLLRHEAQAPWDRINVAIEVERTDRRRDQLIDRLKVYLAETRVDGLLYIAPDFALQERLLDVYQSKALRLALKRSRFGRRFVLFGDGTVNGETLEPLLFDRSLNATSLKDWMSNLTQGVGGWPRAPISQLQTSPRKEVGPPGGLSEKESPPGDSTA